MHVIDHMIQREEESIIDGDASVETGKGLEVPPKAIDLEK
jgi:hypothetical protein